MPKVSFVVPCYNLAHLLSDCVTSMLEQTFGDFEILIMDDASPDNTPEVARGFGDPRVRHVRNEKNLGHLRNYNKGIALSRGDYVWLVSADDRIRRPYALEKYVALMEAHPEVGFVFCPGYGLVAGEETDLLDYSSYGDEDAIFDGRKFLSRLLLGNTVVAASGMVRKTLYERLGAFPLDLPFAGDWYLWCLFAVHSDVGYFAEPLVNYRAHQLSITNEILKNRENPWKDEGIAVAWRIKREVEVAGHSWLTAHCDDSIVRQYASSLGEYGMTPDRFEQSLNSFSTSPEEAGLIRRRGYLSAGDRAFWAGDRRLAATLYGLAMKSSPANGEAIMKYGRLRLGKVGDRIRGGLGATRHGRRETAC